MSVSLSSIRNDFNFLCHLSVNRCKHLFTIPDKHQYVRVWFHNIHIESSSHVDRCIHQLIAVQSVWYSACKLIILTIGKMPILYWHFPYDEHDLHTPAIDVWHCLTYNDDTLQLAASISIYTTGKKYGIFFISTLFCIFVDCAGCFCIWNSFLRGDIAFWRVNLHLTAKWRAKVKK